MKPYTLRLLEDRLKSGSEINLLLPAHNRVIYVVKGLMSVLGKGDKQTFSPNEAWFGSGECSVKAGEAGARLWRWELVDSPPPDDAEAAGDGVSTIFMLAEEIDVNPVQEYLMRCDRVDFPLGGIAYTHVHQGPGIRCLLKGELTVRVNDVESSYRHGEPWFEAGPHPVYAVTSTSDLTAFIRAMILPRRLKGKTSISYVREEDKDKPKKQTYTRFVDEFIDV